jgi:hypothetical protein
LTHAASGRNPSSLTGIGGGELGNGIFPVPSGRFRGNEYYYHSKSCLIGCKAEGSNFLETTFPFIPLPLHVSMLVQHIALKSSLNHCGQERRAML